MIKALLVDDEKVIREGLAEYIGWARMEIQLAGLAGDGIEALEMIETHRPDIVVTDIKMPRLDGIGLIEQAYSRYPGTRFIILSGHGEFDYAHSAMQYGVRHYLLKPCDEAELEDALAELKRQLEEEAERGRFIQALQADLQIVLPQVKESFFQNALHQQAAPPEDYDYFRRLFGFDESPGVLVALQGSRRWGYETCAALQRISLEQFAADEILLHTITGDCIFLLVRPEPLDVLTLRLERAGAQFNKLFNRGFVSAVSFAGRLEQLPAQYREVMQCLAYGFYVEDGAVITARDIPAASPVDDGELDLLKMRIANCISTGNRQQLGEELNGFFAMVCRLPDSAVAVNHCMELYLAIVRRAKRQPGDSARGLLALQQTESLAEARRLLEAEADEIVSAHYRANNSAYGALVRQVCQLVEDRLEDPELSLSKIAREILYMNSDYLGRLFHREMGEHFSAYLLNARLEKAKALIAQGPAAKVYEVAEQVGFSGNPQYFSQVFKKHTGMTPKEYIGYCAGGGK